MQIRSSTLHGWINKYKEGNEIHRGSRNYASDEAKENARLRKELRDAKNALEILKKRSAPWATNREDLLANGNTGRRIKARRATPPQCQRDATDSRRFSKRLP